MRSQGAGLGLDLHRGADLKDGVKAMFEHRTWGLDSLLTQEKERGWKRKINVEREERAQNRVGEAARGEADPHQTGPVQPIKALVVLGGIEEEEG